MIDSYHQKLQKYYKQLFPVNLICEWFGYSYSRQYNRDLHCRQFSFTLQIENEQIYKRFIAYRNSEELKAGLVGQVPVKIDIGAIMKDIPKKGVNTPEQKQFVLDIDIDDYDNVRNCHKGAEICDKCWKLMRTACKILYRSMKEDYGFQDMLFVFSGRRGLHLWVCDYEARMMEDNMRRSIMDYLYLVTGNQKNDSQLSDNVIQEIKVPAKQMFKKHKKYFNTPQDMTQKVNIKNYFYRTHLHPFIVRSLRIIQELFQQVFIEQHILTTEATRLVVEKIIKDRNNNLLLRIQDRWRKSKSDRDMYEVMLAEIQQYQRFPETFKGQYHMEEQFDKNQPFKLLTFIEEEIQLTFMYPRLDTHVSTNKNHLLKCPFSVHPKSLKISVPFDYDSVESFDPQRCIKLDDLLEDYKSIEPERLHDKSNQAIAKLTVGLSVPIIVLEQFVKKTISKLKKSTNPYEF